MPSLLIKDIPAKLHRQLKAKAQLHRRSMAKEVLCVLEQAGSRGLPDPLPEPVRPTRRITAAMVRKGIREGRL